MRALAVMALCAALSAPVKAADLSALPYIWQVGVKVAQWVQDGSRRLYYVEVTTQGRDHQDAREQAFRQAVEQAVGAVVSSNTQVQSGELVRDEIIVYSSGFVEDYTIIQQQSWEGGVRMRVKVWVSASRLSQRLLGESRREAGIDGARFDAQISTFRYQAQQGDRLLNSVLEDLPRRAFLATITRTRIEMDKSGRTHLIVPLELRWNPDYLASLREAAERTSSVENCVQNVGNPVNIFRRGCRAQHRVTFNGNDIISGFDDGGSYQQWDNALSWEKMAVRLQLRDQQGLTRSDVCYRFFDQLLWRADGRNIHIFSNKTLRAQIEVDPRSVPLSELNEAAVEITTWDQCRSRG